MLLLGFWPLTIVIAEGWTDSDHILWLVDYFCPWPIMHDCAVICWAQIFFQLTTVFVCPLGFFLVLLLLSLFWATIVVKIQVELRLSITFYLDLFRCDFRVMHRPLHSAVVDRWWQFTFGRFVNRSCVPCHLYYAVSRQLLWSENRVFRLFHKYVGSEIS